MHETMQRLFAENDAPTHASAARASELVGAVLDMIGDLQQQATVYKRLLWAWKTAPDADMKDKYEWFKQSLDAGETALADMARAAERVSDSWSQLDRYLAEGKTEIAQIETERATKADADHIALGASAEPKPEASS